MYHAIDALRTECAALEELLVGLSEEQWLLVTDFYNWSIRDQVMHLYQVDQFGMAALESQERFDEEKSALRDHQARGIEMSAYARLQYGDLDQTALFAQWRSTWRALCDKLAALEPNDRLPWFGPSMSVRSFASARQMEVWAHGQNIYDCLGFEREDDDRIRNICHLGVNTFGWSFANRDLPVPHEKVKVELTAPSGETWQWNAEGNAHIQGAAVDFAMVVTQRRNVADTGLRISGGAAREWMAIAQCFAGAPADPPPPRH